MTTYHLHETPYPDDLIERYQRYSNLPGFVLLESSDKLRGRYDILSAYPYDCVSVEPPSSFVKDVFTKLADKFPRIVNDLDLPFQGGAIGYFSYDLACYLAGIKMSPQADLSALPLMHVGFYDWAIIVDHHLKKVTFFAANTRTNTQDIMAKMMLKWDEPCIKKKPLRLNKWFKPLITKELYATAVDAIQGDLRRGRCYQANLTQAFVAEGTMDAWRAYEKIRDGNRVPFSAMIRLPEFAILSFSPERFLHGDKGKLYTAPIKGSIRRSENAEEDKHLQCALKQCVKNQAENVMIVDLMRNDLSQIARPGSVRVTGLCELESYQGVHHLVSYIEADCLPNISPFQAFAACFPGGSITGAPKREAMKVIAENEAFARGVYCGSLGYFSFHGRFDSNIAIRTMVVTQTTTHLAAGGAIVMDSEWETEYEECFTKLSAILKGLQG